MIRLSDYIAEKLKDPDFKKCWEEDNGFSISEALEELANQEVAAVEEDPFSLESILKNNGIKATVKIPNTILFYEYQNKCPVADFISNIDDKKLQSKILHDMERLAFEGHNIRPPLSKYVRNGIFELRTQQSNNITRIFYFFVYGEFIILTNGYIKKSEKMDQKEFEKAEDYREEFLRRKR